MTGKILIVLINWLKQIYKTTNPLKLQNKLPENDWDSLDEYDDLITNNENEDSAWILREQIANNSRAESIESKSN